MAGAVKLKKRLNDAIYTLCASIHDGIMEGELSMEEVNQKENLLKEYFTQYREAVLIVEDTYKYWKEGEKVAKLHKEIEGVEDIVQFNFQALSRYAMATTHEVTRLTHAMEALETTVKEIPTPTTETLRTPKEKPPISPKPKIVTPVKDTGPTVVADQSPGGTEKLTPLEQELKKQLLELSQKHQAVLTALQGEHASKDTVAKVLEFDDKGEVHTEKAPLPVAYSTPLVNLDLREDDTFDSMDSNHLYINASFLEKKGRRMVTTEHRAREQSVPWVSSGPPVQPRVPNEHDMLHDTLTEYLRSGRKHEKVPARNELPKEMSSEDCLKNLTRIPLPKFSGNKLKFEGWWATFNTVVDASNVPEKVKLLKLYDSLSGSALEAVEKFGFNEMSYIMAKEKLVRKYGGARRKMAIRCEELLEFRPMKDDVAEELERFSELLDSLVLNMYENDEKSELGSGTLYHSLLKKLTPACCSRFQRWLFDHTKVASVLTLREFINQEALFMVSAAESVRGLAGTRKTSRASGSKTFTTTTGQDKKGEKGWKAKSQNSGNGKTGKVAGTGGDGNDKPKRKWVCKVCSGEHGLWACAKFIQKSLGEKWEILDRVGACYRCLNFHPPDKCYRKRPCTVSGCNQSHHYILHNDKEKSTENQKTYMTENTQPKVGYEPSMLQTPAQAADQSLTDTTDTAKPNGGNTMSGQTYMVANAKKRKGIMMFRTVPVVLQNDGRSIKVNALLDDCSDTSYISEDVSAYLHLVGENVETNVGSVNNSRMTVHSQEVCCELLSVDSTCRALFYARTLPTISNTLKATRMSKEKEYWPHLANIEFPELENTTIDVLIGLDNVELMCADRGKDITGRPGDPIARQTPLGWTCVGLGRGDPEMVSNAMLLHTFHITTEDRLDAMVQRYFELETVAETKIVKPAEQAAMKAVQESITYENGRYKVGIPWKEGRPEAINNYEAALKKARRNHKRMKKDRPLGQAIKGIVHEYKEKDYVRKLKASAAWDKVSLFLSNFPVVREEADTTKVRLVFNASEEIDGVSLNSLIHIGPKLQKDLIVILLRFRRYEYGLSNDLMQMYMQILMLEEDRPFQRFIFIDPDTDEIELYEFTRVVFGMNVSPFLAQFVCQQHVEKYRGTKPEGAAMAGDSTYMDDGLDSRPTLEKGRQTIREVKEIWDDCGMLVHKWLSNSRTLLSELESTELGKKVDLSKHELPKSKAVGQWWDAHTDELTYKTKVNQLKTIDTKRKFLSTLASIFDPLGIAAPILIKGKIILQKIWERGVDWDDPLPKDLCDEILHWLTDVSYLESFKVSRVLIKMAEGEIEIHSFSDASGDAYGAVVFIRNWMKDRTPWINIALGKTKVAPLAAISIPRMELMGGIVSSRLVGVVRNVLDIGPHNCFYHTDSQDVLYWITGHCRDYKPFVTNRVGEIQRETVLANWRYVPGHLNPADLLTRGITGSEFIESRIWRQGPDFLSLDKSQWPEWRMPVSTEARKELKKYSVTTFMITKTDGKVQGISKSGVQITNLRIAPQRFSSWQRLIDVTAYVLRAVNRFRFKDGILSDGLSQAELTEAEQLQLRCSQERSFPAEVKALKREKEISSSSVLVALQPWLDEEGLVRGRSRLERGEQLSWNLRYPVLLLRSDYVPFLLARAVHEQMKHAGPGMIATELQQRFWIPGVRVLARHVISECAKCRRLRAKPCQPFMGPLPPDRLQASKKVFSVTATDYAGPFMTKAGRGRARNKRYLCLFTCAHTRAVHLEMAYDLTTAGFLMAFTRFHHRRGVPDVIISDHGSNYLGGNRELKELVQELNYDEVLKATQREGHRITWKFNPPVSPHFSGVHEAMIKSAKAGMYRILHGSDVTDEQLQTVIAEVEGMLNSRPITTMRTDINDLDPLTPNHFITGQMKVRLPQDDLSFEGEVKHHWRHVQCIATQVWRRWLREWISSLSPRQKWLKHTPDLKVNDVVLLLDPHVPRYKWNIGKIVAVFPGVDGVVRVADVQVGDTVYRRPAVKLCFLTD